ncbi:MAG: Spx/MgsR family RNA polymerase-binding regulatory protein [Candidatus Acidiferrales bacterium]
MRQKRAKKKSAKTPANAPRRARAAGLVQFLQKPTCTTCRKAREYLENRGVELHFRDLDKQRLSAEELEKLIGDRDHKEFLNTRNEQYRERKMKENPPSRDEAIQLMAQNPNLIRRPVVLAGGRVVLGFDSDEYSSL